MNPRHDLLPENIKKYFYELTMIEEMLISPVIPIMSVYRLNGGQFVNITSIVTSLPRLIKDIPILIVKKNGTQNNSKEFKVNRNRVCTVLKFLIENNPSWKSHCISIDSHHLNLLPEDTIPNDFNEINDDKLNPEEQNIINQDLGPEIHDNT
ncbi:ATP-dependent DNA helicase PIF1, partial [Brachionus plicatilis]